MHEHGCEGGLGREQLSRRVAPAVRGPVGFHDAGVRQGQPGCPQGPLESSVTAEGDPPGSCAGHRADRRVAKGKQMLSREDASELVVRADERNASAMYVVEAYCG